MIQLIAMDMDGTLLTPPPVHISAPTLDVLRAASDRGIHLALASGRLPEDAGSFAAQASLDMAVIALNGSCMALHPLHSLVHLHHLQNETATILMKRFLHLGLTFGLFSGEDLYIHDEDPTHPSPAMMWGTYLPSEHIFRKEAEGWRLVSNGVSKFVVVDRRACGMLTEMREEILERFPYLSVTSSWMDNLEINPEHVDKGSALRTLADEMDIPMEHVMAIGDNSNDLPMLLCSGLSVAMGNATADVLENCTFRTLDHTQDGVASAIAHLVLGIPRKGVVRLRP